MDSTTFLGGSVPLDIAQARTVFESKVANPLGMDVDQAAIGIYRIACAQLSDLVRNVTVERGLDPRDFTLHSFGGSCGLFAGAFARELGINRVVIPFTASVNCAFGMVAADVLHHFAVVKAMPAPAGAQDINEVFAPLQERALLQLRQEGFAEDQTQLLWSVDLRYRRQVHQVTTPLTGSFPFAQDATDALLRDFEHLYELRYGKGSAFRAAGIELVTFRLKACGLMKRPDALLEQLGGEDAGAALTGKRSMFVEGHDTLHPADVYDFALLRPGNLITGPAVVHSAITTIVVQPHQAASMDGWRNLILEPR
jgi:N-methylhydantoinase A